ncbi:MucR family transcriptional regulator [Oryzicola mucosus]|uniref:MucR family transcriptional regulator n=1 Tax=Oryzicola mucosus TaxID=2767425 RepID=A0A8J6Q5M1_9HYPH|nr:MucR family transcriptional regulator [Oryzicola mucosus]
MPEKVDLIEITAEIVSSYVSKNPVPRVELPALIASVYTSFKGIERPDEQTRAPEPQTPAVPIKKSVTPDFIISLEDGRKFRSLKRHLMTSYGMTPDDYRKKWNLPADYPMVAPGYAEARSALARKTGLGRKPRTAEVAKPTASRNKSA